MKEATGEVSMTVITIVLIALVLGIAMFLFGNEDSIGRTWITDTFTNMTNTTPGVNGNGAIDG